MKKDTIYREDAIEAIRRLPNAGIHWYVSAEAVFDALLKLPSAQPDPSQCWGCNCPKMNAQPTLCGYNIEHLELIARVLQKENLPPERVAEVLTDIGRIIAIVKGEFEEALRKAVEQCTI